MVDEINDVRIIGIITAVAMMAIALAGLSWESKVLRWQSLSVVFEEPLKRCSFNVIQSTNCCSHLITCYL